MSKISLSPNALGSGTLTIAAPNTNSDASITLPAITGGEFIVSNASGNVGIGTSSPTQAGLVVSKIGTDTSTSARIAIKSNLSATDTYLRVARYGTGNDAAMQIGNNFNRDGGGFSADSSSYGVTAVQFDNGFLAFGTGAAGAAQPTERMRIASDGSQSSVIPGGTTLFPQFACRAWVNIEGTSSASNIRASGNVSSVTRNSQGDHTLNFTTAMPDANYTVNISGSRSDNSRLMGFCSYIDATTTSVRVYTGNTGGTSSENWPLISVAIVR